MRRWRELTGGAHTPDSERKTVVACSGGPDSCGLVLALHAYGGVAAVVHIVHDLRPRIESLADRDVAAGLARALGLPFAEACVEVAAAQGNTEAAARSARYEALASLAERCGSRLIATAHHADDQLETILLRLTRGAGPRAFDGIKDRRRLSAKVLLVRPALRTTRDELRALCNEAGVRFASDQTNFDESRARAFIRAQVTPALVALSPHAARHAAAAASRQALVADYLLAGARSAMERCRTVSRDGTCTLDRALLRAESPAIIAEVLILAARVVTVPYGKVPGRAPHSSSIESLSKAVRGAVGGARVFRLGRAKAVLTRDHVQFVSDETGQA